MEFHDLVRPVLFVDPCSPRFRSIPGLVVIPIDEGGILILDLRTARVSPRALGHPRNRKADA